MFLMLVLYSALVEWVFYSIYGKWTALMYSHIAVPQSSNGLLLPCKVLPSPIGRNLGFSVFESLTLRLLDKPALPAEPHSPQNQLHLVVLESRREERALTSAVDLWSGGGSDLRHGGAHVQLSQSQLIHKVRQLQGGHHHHHYHHCLHHHRHRRCHYGEIKF